MKTKTNNASTSTIRLGDTKPGIAVLWRNGIYVFMGVIEKQVWRETRRFARMSGPVNTLWDVRLVLRTTVDPNVYELDDLSVIEAAFQKAPEGNMT